MKTKVLLAVTILAGFAVSAQAATIVGSKHDLRVTTSGSVNITGTTQTCVFCHAPHNAKVNKLLWNRANVLTGTDFKIYTSYNSSAMRTALIGTKTLTDKSTSLLCLSCHSLASTADLVTNSVAPSGTTFADGSSTPASDRWAAKTGNMSDLSNDHPVGINYISAYGADNNALTAATGTASVGDAKVRLFNNPDVGDGTMECATCHLVHDATQPKFLAISNTNSGLCTNCHKK